MGSWAAASVLPNQFIPFYATIAKYAMNSKLGASFHKIYRSTNKGKFRLSFARDNYVVRSTLATKSSRRGYYLQTQQKQGTWEEPDIGSDSEYGDEEDESLGFESDMEEEETETSAITGVSITSQDKYEEITKKEVEQLLEPEERAILQQNLTPNMGKISSVSLYSAPVSPCAPLELLFSYFQGKWSPLHSLALSMQISCMDKLLENGSDIDSLNKEGLTALHKAIIGKKEAVISHLLRKGASPHVKDKDGATALHYAVQVGAKQTVKLLIKYKVDVNVADNEGWTPLHAAIQSRNRDIAKILLVNGADKTVKNKDGKTALELSLCYGKDFKSYDLARLVKVVPANRVL